MAMGARDLALGGDSPRSWQPGPEGQTWWELLLVPGGSGGYHVGRVGLQWWLHPLHVMSLNSGALLLWQSGYLPQAFLVVNFLPSIPSDCLLTVNGHLPPKFGLQSPFPGFSPHCELANTPLSLGCTGLWHRPYVGLTLLCLPQISCFILLQ